MFGFIKNKKYYIDELEKKVEHHFEDVAGIKIHYVTFGSGPLIVLIHGWNNDWSGFIPFIKELHGFQILAIDLPGYGASGSLKGEYSVEVMAEKTAGLLLKINKVAHAVAALSMGTVVGVEFANKHPELLKKLILIGPPLIKYDWAWSKAYRTYIRVLNSNSVFRFLGKQMMAGYWYGHFTAKYMNMYKYEKNLIDKFGMRGRKKINPRALFQIGVSMYNYNMKFEMRRLTLPTLVILGQFDKLVDLSEAQKIKTENSNIKLSWVASSGHVVSLEKPKSTAKAVDEFMKKST